MVLEDKSIIYVLSGIFQQPPNSPSGLLVSPSPSLFSTKAATVILLKHKSDDFTYLPQTFQRLHVTSPISLYNKVTYSPSIPLTLPLILDGTSPGINQVFFNSCSTGLKIIQFYSFLKSSYYY